MRKYIIIGILCVFVSTSLRSQEVTQILIDPSRSYQTIEHFAASDCWTAKDVGYYWEENVREEIARWLFSSGLTHDGSPEGIALSSWRFNLGSGSVNDSEMDATRRTETFFNESEDGYDWTKQAGQQWFMDKARSYGCDHFVAFSNSPLVKYTRNGKGYANAGEPEANLQDDKYDDYARYVADVMKGFEEQGKGFQYFSPVNEPQYVWDTPTQEGSPWQNRNIKKMVEELDKAFLEKDVQTKILIAEAGDWTYLYRTDPNKHGGRASNQIYSFFDRRSDLYIGNLPSLAPVIGAHSYWTTSTNAEMKSIRENVYVNAKKYDLKVFQTEWSMLSGGEGIPGDLALSSYMDNALFLAKVVYSDMAHAEVTSWSYWTALGVEQWSHKNRFLLISLVPGAGIYGPITLSGTASATKNLWTLGNYSYFVRPGYKRVKMKGADDMAGLMGTAYLAPDSGKIVAVFVNMATEDKKVNVGFENTSLIPATNKFYLTNSSYNLRKYGPPSSEEYQKGKEYTVPARSVMTFVYEIDKNTSGVESIRHGGNAGVSPNPVVRGEEVWLSLPDEPDNKECTFTLTSLSGGIVWQEKKDLKDGQVNLRFPANLPAGVFLLNSRGLNKVYVNKIVAL